METTELGVEGSGFRISGVMEKTMETTIVY